MNAQTAANTAIYHLQLPLKRAVKFVTGNANVDRKKALSAIDNALVGYKNKARS